MSQQGQPIAQHGDTLCLEIGIFRDGQHLSGVDGERREIKPIGHSTRATDVSGKAFAIGAVLTADNSGLDQFGKVTPQGAFGHTVQPFTEFPVRWKDHSAAALCRNQLFRQKRHQGLQNGEGSMRDTKFGRCLGQRREDVPFVDGGQGARLRHPKRDLGSMFHRDFHEKGKNHPPLCSAQS